MPSTINIERIAGAAYGLALGDALGRITEFSSVKQAYRVYGRHDYVRLPTPALITDDTQMTIAVSRALGSDNVTPRKLIARLRVEFSDWHRNDPPRAPGVSCVTSIRNHQKLHRQKQSWVLAPVLSRGCGANMRVFPTALLPDFDEAMGATQLQAAFTHAHPDALAASELTAVAIRLAVQGTPISELWSILVDYAYDAAGHYRGDWLGDLGERRWGRPVEIEMKKAWYRLAGLIYVVPKAVNDRRIVDACKVLGAGWVADEALATALFYALKYADRPEVGIAWAARTSGDSDSIASIAGAILGGSHGETAWPTNWRQRIERRMEIEAMIAHTGRRYE